MLSAGVIGLGQAGSLFDEENRDTIWSHAGAYLRHSALCRLVAGVDPDSGRRKKFQSRCPDARVFENADSMVREVTPDVLSICTPVQHRFELISQLLDTYTPKALVVEKPLESNSVHRRQLLDLCRDQGVSLLVHYNRRYLSLFRQCRDYIAAGKLGRLMSITILSPNRIWSVGSHAANLLLYLADGAPEKSAVLPLPHLEEEGEGAADILCRFENGITGRIVTGGAKKFLVMEVDIIGTEGRLRIVDNGRTVLLSEFQESDVYAGYQVLHNERPLFSAAAGDSSFVNITLEALETAEAGIVDAASAETALASEAMIDELQSSISLEETA